MILPIELIEPILENLYCDKHSLLQCALVSRALVSASQRGIFHHITLESPDFAKSAERYNDLSRRYIADNARLIALFDKNPRFATYVQAVNLRCFCKSMSVSPRDHDGYDSTARVIQRLLNVNQLSFILVEWDKLSSSLNISKFAEFASLISHATHLKELRFGSLECRRLEYASGPGLTFPAEIYTTPRPGLRQQAQS
ncbi:hypothetical protein BT96DRAFT_1002334 [Gymnopus androsaceus JB14]|uniref:F-box domain-containing protein n=1 Tax=Gymnopus androsaceus JB14 TaxID=1447944 RepID=A0A6A4GY50_9AGAR|nr:hypothetical protein BT96DRAFT_1002334 [Gymnopus androsaceus JB14]